jgi:DNA topoisomerase-1
LLTGVASTRVPWQAVEQMDTKLLREEVADKCAYTLFPSKNALPPLPTRVDGAQTTGGASASLSPSAPTPLASAAAARGDLAPAPAAAEAEAEAAAQAVRPERVCPSCGVGQMSLKFSRFGPFVGCSEYPTCGWTTRPREPWANADEQPTIDKLALGTLAADALPEPTGSAFAGLEVSVRDGPVGWYVQAGGNVTHEQRQLTPPPDVKALKVVQLRDELEKRGLDTSGRKAQLAERLLMAPDLRHLVAHKRVSLPEGVRPSELTMEMAVRLLSLPCALGVHPTTHEKITLHQGRFGPYVSANMTQAGEVLCSLPKRVSLWDVDVAQAAELLDSKMARNAKRAASRAGATTAAASKVRGAKKTPATKVSKPKVSKSKVSKPRASKAKVSV